ncbi:MAG: hypothetical protein WBW16_12065 [Bacteroidota bacterium]
MVSLKEGDSSTAGGHITGAANFPPEVNGEGRLSDRWQDGTRFIGNLDKERFLLGEFTATTEFDYDQRTVVFAILGVNPQLHLFPQTL